jgi:TetR/AcrR family transcriptional regulator, transcriptional repressor for nem operon
MRVSKEEAMRSRERIVAVASQLFREHGIDGIGVADLMKEAGFTHGGFYKHFESKDSLAVEACAQAFADLQQNRWGKLLKDDGKGAVPARRFIESYLSKPHRDNPGKGCPLPSLGADASRHEPELRRVFADGLTSLADSIAGVLPGSDERERRHRALAILGCLVGAMTLARAVDDKALSAEILESAVHAFD